jgi:hypothetical protein
MEVFMKKLITAMLALCLLVSLAACSGGSNVDSFLKEVSGLWYSNGNSEGEMLRIKEDGSWEYYAGGSDNDMTDSGGKDSMSYDETFENWFFDSSTEQGTTYSVEPEDNETLKFSGVLFVRAEISSGLSEYNGEWYLDGDSEQEFYRFENGDWDLWTARVDGGRTTESNGHLVYKGGENKRLTITDGWGDVNIECTFNGDNEINADGKTYVRLNGLTEDYDMTFDSAEEENAESSETSNLELVYGEYYYLDGDSEAYYFYFYDESAFDFFSSEAGVTYPGVYSVDGNTITLNYDDGDTGSLTIEEGGAAVVTDSGDRCTITVADSGEADAEETDTEAVYDVFGDYYQSIDREIDAYSYLSFYPDGTLTMYYDGDEFDATYEVSGDRLTITNSGNGETIELTVLDEDNLFNGSSGVSFVRWDAYDNADGGGDDIEASADQTDISGYYYCYYGSDATGDTLYFNSDGTYEAVSSDGTTGTGEWSFDEWGELQLSGDAVLTLYDETVSELMLHIASDGELYYGTDYVFSKE